MKNNILSQFMEALVEINHVEKGRFKYNNHSIASSLTRSCIGKYSLEWSSDIIRDEVYYCIWRALTVIGEHYSEQELNDLLGMFLKGSRDYEINLFLNRVKQHAALDIKKYMINSTKRASDGSYIDIISVATDFQDLDYLFGEFTIEEEQTNNHFAKWFIENKNTILTKKQKEYINGEKIIPECEMDAKMRRNNQVNSWRMRQRIAQRALDKYTEQFPIDNIEAEYQEQINTIEAILEHENFVGCLLSNHEKDVVIDAIYDNVSKDDIKTFNRNTKAKQEVPAEVQKAYRVALFKKLKKLYDKVEEK